MYATTVSPTADNRHITEAFVYGVYHVRRRNWFATSKTQATGREEMQELVNTLEKTELQAAVI